MQTTCPQCSQGIIVDDAKVPDRPFAVRCPYCRSTIRISGREGMPHEGVNGSRRSNDAETQSRLSPTKAVTSAHPAETSLPMIPEDARVQMVAQVRREMGEKVAVGRALVALDDGEQVDALTTALIRQGFAVDALGDGEEAKRQLERGTYELVAATRKSDSTVDMYQFLLRLSPEARRRVFVLLVGKEFRSGDPVQAFAAVADLVLHPRDLAVCDAALSAALIARLRLYHAFLEARRRLEGIVS